MSLKLVKKLTDKKYREETGLFIVEGKKGIDEVLASDFIIDTVYVTLEHMSDVEEKASTYGKRTGHSPEIICVVPERLEASGTFRSNNAGIAIVRQREAKTLEAVLEEAEQNFVLALDDVRDPGNLGTIIRTADWFGVTHICMSETTSDPYNPKVIAATMGSFTRVHSIYQPLTKVLEESKKRNIPCMGALLEGRDILETPSPKSGIILLGSESHGINRELLPFINDKITIPRFGNAESLNVATAAGVILALLRKA